MLACAVGKGHGLGTESSVGDGARFGISLTPERVRLLCHRNLGLGSDGVLEVQSRLDGFHARIWNPDGSEAERSGNGLRIVAKFLSDHGYTAEGSFVISTIAGPVAAQVMKRAGRVHSVRLEMGRATIDRARKALDAGGKKLDVTVVSVGNPHCVIFGEPFTRERLFAIGPLVERHAAFPERINVQLCTAESRRRVRALVWERGAGHTLASGTSACAVATACFDRGLVDGTVTVVMEGGQLEVELSKDLDLIMTGPVEEVFEGTLSPDLRQRLVEMQ